VEAAEVRHQDGLPQRRQGLGAGEEVDVVDGVAASAA
jgi:hypothetical protein